MGAQSDLGLHLGAPRRVRLKHTSTSSTPGAECGTTRTGAWSPLYSRVEADVELQTVLVPHLTSLPPRYASVKKEIRRLRVKGWYESLRRCRSGRCILQRPGHDAAQTRAEQVAAHG
eukprot:339734-Pleurochrysis_carterae.AAC.2